MSFSFQNVGHFFASVAHDFVKGAALIGVLGDKAKIIEPELEALTGIVLPAAAPLVRGAFAVFGIAAHAVSASGAAAHEGGMNVQLDADVVASIRQLIPMLEAYAKKNGIQKPAQP